MVPTIGLMIGVYILFRFTEIFARASSRYSSRGAHITMVVFAVLGWLIVAFCTLDLLLSGTKTTSLP
jgi:hypothetical protein